MFVFNWLRRILGLIYLHLYDEVHYKLSKVHLGPWRLCKPFKEGKIMKIINLPPSDEVRKLMGE